jgi:hypothetical protein
MRERQMTSKKLTLVATVAAALTLLGCGGSSNGSQTTATVGAAGATLKAGAATLSIPAGAVTKDTQVTLRETEPRHQGAVTRVEMEPHLQLEPGHAAQVSVQVDDKNVKLKMVDDNGGLHGVELEDRNHHKYKTSMSQLGEIEVEVEHGQTCAAACGANEECDDGVCKAHAEDASTKVCTDVCTSGQECDDAVCKAHNEVEIEHGNTTGNPTCPPCGSGMECDLTDGICKPHGGTP